MLWENKMLKNSEKFTLKKARIELSEVNKGQLQMQGKIGQHYIAMVMCLEQIFT